MTLLGWIYQDGTMRLLPLPPDSAYNAIELADGNSGRLVGTAISPAGGGPRPPERGFILDPVARTYTFIEPLAGDAGTNAWGVNAAGDVVGNSFNALRQRAILHTSGVTIDLNTCVTLDGTSFASLDIARRINGRGQIIGVGTTTSGSRRAFLLDPLMPVVSENPAEPSEPADPLPVSIAFGDLVHTYDGATHVATITSDPSLPVQGDPTGTLIVYYDDRTAYGLASGPSGAPYTLYPSHPGDHTVRVNVYSNEQRYAGSATATLRIVPATVSISLGRLDQAYDGAPKPVTFTCSPATAVRPEGAGIEPMRVEITYDGRAMPPTEPGVYEIVATVKSYGYIGSAIGTLAVAAPEEPPSPSSPPASTPPAEPPAPSEPDTALEPTGRIGSPRLVNVSSRGRTWPGGDPLIAGFVIDGQTPQQVLIRAVGPGLTEFGVADAVTEPRLTLYRAGAPIAHNDRWDSTADASTLAAVTDAVGAFELHAGSADAALLTVLEPGAYTAVLTNADAKPGGALIEIYDASSGSSRLVNLSTRGRVGPVDRALISGLVVNGPAPKRMLIRAVGPGLADFGVSDPLPSPNIRIMAGGELVVAATGWSDDGTVSEAASAAGAFPLVPGNRDAAVVVTLPAGAYTAVVGSDSGDTGSVLLEVYELP